MSNERITKNEIVKLLHRVDRAMEKLSGFIEEVQHDAGVVLQETEKSYNDLEALMYRLSNED